MKTQVKCTDLKATNKKKDLIVLIVGDSKYYYSNVSQAAEALNITRNRVLHCLKHTRYLKNLSVKFEIVEAESVEVPYYEVDKYIIKPETK